MSFERKKKLIPEEVCPGLVQERMSNDNLFDRDQLEGARGYNNFRFVPCLIAKEVSIAIEMQQSSARRDETGNKTV